MGIELDNLPEEDNRRPQSPFKFLGSAELQYLTFYLEIADLIRLHMALNQPNKSLLFSLATELRYDPRRGAYMPSLTLPSPHALQALFAQLSSLRSVKLLRLKPPYERLTLSLRTLPPTLQHIELELLRPTPRQYDLPRQDPFLNMDFGASFPQLASFRIKANWMHTDWITTLPPSLTALSICADFRIEKTFAFINGEVGRSALARHRAKDIEDETSDDESEDESDDESDEAPLPRASNNGDFLPPFIRPFPSLVLLELNSEKHIPAYTPALAALPPSLTHFGWTRTLSSEDFRFISRQECARSPTTEPKTEINCIALRSLDVNHVSNWFSPIFPLERLIAASPYVLPKTLTELTLLNYHVSFPNDIFERLQEADIKLKLLWVGEIMVPDGPALNNQLSNLIASVLSTVDTLRLRKFGCPLFPFLPSTLRTLHFHESDIECWTDEHLNQLPRGITRLNALPILIELGYVPLLPPSLLDLAFRPINNKEIGTKFLTPEMRLPGLSYDTISTSTNVLFGLPPNLRYLCIFGTLDFESRLGLFLPRSLIKLSSSDASYAHGRIYLRDTSESRFRSIGQYIGLSEAPKTKEELLQRAINFFPPGCICSVPFYDCNSEDLAPFISGFMKEKSAPV